MFTFCRRGRNVTVGYMDGFGRQELKQSRVILPLSWTDWAKTQMSNDGDRVVFVASYLIPLGEKLLKNFCDRKLVGLLLCPIKRWCECWCQDTLGGTLLAHSGWVFNTTALGMEFK